MKQSIAVWICTLGLVSALPAAAEGVSIEDAFARAATPASKSGAAFMRIVNTGDEDDRLIEARSEIANRVELHTHLMDTQGVMRMVEVEDGFVVPANGETLLERGGAHVMFMGLKQPLTEGTSVSLTLVFERAGEIAVEVPVDLNR